MRGQWEYKGYWLDNNVRKSPYWYAYWYESAAAQRAGRQSRKSTKRTDFEEAKDWLVEFIQERETGSHDALIISVLEKYVTAMEEGRLDIASKKPVYRAQLLITETLEGPETVGMLTEDFQKKTLWGPWREQHGHSANYMARNMTVLKSAIDYCGIINPPQIIQTEAGIAKRMKIRKTTKGKWFPKSEDDLARFIDKLGSDAAFKWTIIALCTSCRPDAGVDLGPAQVNTADRLLDLNPPGRPQQPNKWRPVQRLTSCLEGWVSHWKPEVQVIEEKDALAILRQEKPWKLLPRYVPVSDTTVGSAYKRTRALTDKEGKSLLNMPLMSPYSIRNFMVTEMRRVQVPGSQRSIWMGHMDEEEKRTTSQSYGQFDPSFLQDAADAVDEFMVRLNQRTDRDLFAPSHCKTTAKTNVVEFNRKAAK